MVNILCKYNIVFFLLFIIVFYNIVIYIICFSEYLKNEFLNKLFFFNLYFDIFLYTFIFTGRSEKSMRRKEAYLEEAMSTHSAVGIPDR